MERSRWNSEGAPGAESGRWLHLVVMLEFQAGVDYLMALRIRNYVDHFHMEQLRGKRFRSTDRLEPVLPTSPLLCNTAQFV